ncbi:MAG: type II CAAX endopeptidase family protein [Candidatus Peregrinibacteria bacterium]
MSFYLMKKYFQAPWSIKDILIVFSVIMAATIAAGAGMYIFDAKNYIEESKYRIFILFGIFLLQWLIIFVPLIAITVLKYKLKFRHFGFKKTGIWKILEFVIGGYVIYLGINIILTLIILYAGFKIPGYQLQEKILPVFGDGTVNLVVAGIILVLVAPVLEEIFFRGFLLRSLTNKIGAIYGTVFTAVIFAIFHMQWQSIIPIFILGLIINAMVIKTRSIWPGIYFHIFNNAIAFTLEILILKEVVPLDSVV